LAQELKMIQMIIQELHTFMKANNMKYMKFTVLSLVLASSAQAQIDMAFRRANAVALYEMSETSGPVVKDSAQLQPALDLTIADASASGIARGVQNGLPYLNILGRNLIQSAGPATKITNACKASGEMTIEVWVENREGAEPSTGNYPTADSAQPNRIVSLATNISKNNFYIGQFYEDAELLYSAINTSGSENQTRPGANLRTPIVTQKNQIIIPALEAVTPPDSKIQKMIVTLSKSEIAKFYLSDRIGTMTKTQQSTTGFNTEGALGLFNDWYTDAKLSLGNVASTPAEVSNSRLLFKSCSTNDQIKNDVTCGQNSRYWKGKIFLVAIYCKALTEDQIIGAAANVQFKNPVMAIDINVSITENLKKSQEIFQRLTGVKTPIYDPVLKQMERLIDANDSVGAAALATQDPRFYNITVRDFASKMSNRAETINVPLNDFTATVIGAVRDNLDARRLLYDNIVYMGDAKKVSAPSDLTFDHLRSNNHYESLDIQRADLSAVLTRFDKNGVALTQKVFDGQRPQEMPTPSGLLTTRAWMSEHAIAGTNRRLVEYNFREFLCIPLEQVADSQGPDNIVARDIDRFPGGSNAKYNTTCKACHTIMDGFRPAFAYMTFNAGYIMHSYTSPSVTSQAAEDMGQGMFKSREPNAENVHDKLNKNGTVFVGGKITTDDNWENNAKYGANKPYFEWKSTSGKGIQDFGRMISESKQFPICMAKRIYKQVCKREPAATDMQMINSAADEFVKTRNYNLKYLFQKITVSKECLGGN
jgi:hypothetical protein